MDGKVERERGRTRPARSTHAKKPGRLSRMKKASRVDGVVVELDDGEINVKQLTPPESSHLPARPAEVPQRDAQPRRGCSRACTPLPSSEKNQSILDPGWPQALPPFAPCTHTHTLTASAPWHHDYFSHVHSYTPLVLEVHRYNGHIEYISNQTTPIYPFLLIPHTPSSCPSAAVANRRCLC
jgi:hypothetical protein